MRLKLIIGVAVGLVVVIAGVYLGTWKFFQDREAMRGYKDPLERQVERRRQEQPVTTTRTYTAKELEEARKTGKLPKNMQTAPGPNQAAIANEAAVQRTLRTLDEINRVNEMNRRLQEQQRK